MIRLSRAKIPLYLCAALALIMVAPLLSGCDYARMKEDEAIQTQKAVMPDMPKRSVPVAAQDAPLRYVDPKSLQNPLLYDPATIARGKENYGFYCAQCHGPAGKGNGTVGQSFAPLPTDLQSPYVQQQQDGEIFYRTSIGFRRHPPMAHTVADLDRWAIVIYIRSLVDQSRG